MDNDCTKEYFYHLQSIVNEGRQTRKLAHRNRLLNGVEQAIALKSDRLKRLWVSRLAHQMSDLPKFDGVFRDVMRAIRAADLPQ